MISGKLIDRGSPIPNAEIRLSERFGQHAIAYTGKSGQFSIGPLTRFEPYRFLLGVPIYWYDLVVRIDGKEFPGYSYGQVGYANMPIDIVCDISKPIRIEYKAGMCDLVKRTIIK